MVESAFGSETDELIERLVRAVESSGCTVATAESLTGGQLASAISAAPAAGDWYRGGIVAYQSEVKQTLLCTPPGPVVTAETAAMMARSAALLLGGDYSVSLTGVGGPDPQEGKPAGTVYIASCKAGEQPTVEHHRFDGEPIEVMRQTIRAAFVALVACIEASQSVAGETE